ncbi:MAG: hypothetical protein RI894_241 [Bacteroidota bacterium]|jgi:ribosomal protein S18 acetylase RimI-like enzyme
MIKIINYTPETKAFIKTLNVEWLQKYFFVEPIDETVLNNPQAEILDKGGVIFYATLQNEIVGTVSLLKINDSTYELTKMAVTEACQGHGIGKTLMEHCILAGKQLGAQKLILYSNTKLETAIALYKKYNFVEIPLKESNYVRSNIKMERYIGNAALYESEEIVENAFKVDALPFEQQRSQRGEFAQLTQEIARLAAVKGAPISVLDIGVGNGRILRWLFEKPEIWQHIAAYDGTDNSQACIDLTHKTIAELGVADKVTAHFADAAQLDKWQKNYDLIITTWFTAGNFFPPNFPFDTYNPVAARLNLDRNPQFEKVWKAAYLLLNKGGAIIFGCVYIDNDSTRRKQESFYRNYGMTAITDEHDSFSATKERFWSQRFTEEKIRKYFQFAPSANITFTYLDDENYAMQVCIE